MLDFAKNERINKGGQIKDSVDNFSEVLLIYLVEVLREYFTNDFHLLVDELVVRVLAGWEVELGNDRVVVADALQQGVLQLALVQFLYCARGLKVSFL